MAMAAFELEQLLKSSFPDGVIAIKDLAGDNEHYAVSVTSSAFKGLSLVRQHQLVYDALEGKAGTVLHALSIKTVSA